MFGFLCALYAETTAQPCNCPEYFQDMVNKIEQNYIGFNYKVTDANRNYYRHFTDSIEQSIAEADAASCLSAMSKWLNFFKDQHVNIALNEEPANIPLIRKTFAHAERVQMTEQDLISYLNDNRHKLDSLEGIWEDEAGAYRVGIIREKDSPDIFTGFVLKADSVLWMPGQVKMKIRKSGGQYTYLAFLSRYHLASTPTLKVHKNRFQNGGYGNWYKAYPAVPAEKRTARARYRPYFKVLDNNTCLIAIPSAMLEYKDDIDSMLASNDALLKRTEHFIIDVRNNRGGSVLCFEKLLPLIYTNPIITKGASVLATEDNIKGYEDWDYPNISDSMKAIFKKEAEELRAHKGGIYNLWPDDTLQYDKVFAYPRRVSVLINESCASSTEMFLLKARQSTKVTLYGKHTMGAVDYSDSGTAELAQGLFLLRYSTSRSNRLPEHPIDNIGIQPDVAIPDHLQDWVGYVKEKN